MSSQREKRAGEARRGLVAALLALALLAAAAVPALAVPDDLKGGSVTIQLQSSRGLRLSPGTVSLPITGGAVDPVNGAGTATVTGAISARSGKRKAKVKILSLIFAANGGRGSIAAKIGKSKVGAFGTLSGGTVTRDGWGARIEGVTATIASKGARALNRALFPRARKGASKSAGGRVKPGQALGKVSAVTVPKSVAVVPGTGTLQLNTDLSGAFANKLPQHCISLTGGVTAVPPAQMLLLPLGAFSFPVSGGSAAPDFSAGELLTAGGQTLAKDNGFGTNGACSSAQPAVGTKLVSTDIGVSFEFNLLMSTAALPTGASLRAPLADIDFSTGTRSFDSSAKTLTVSGATVKLSSLAASTLNTFFPNVSGDPSNDFAAGDQIGTIDVSGAKLR